MSWALCNPRHPTLCCAVEKDNVRRRRNTPREATTASLFLNKSRLDTGYCILPGKISSLTQTYSCYYVSSAHVCEESSREAIMMKLPYCTTPTYLRKKCHLALLACFLASTCQRFGVSEDKSFYEAETCLDPTCFVSGFRMDTHAKI